MSYKLLSTESMLSVFDHWLDPEGARPAIQALDRASRLLPDILMSRDALQNAHAPRVEGTAEQVRLQTHAGNLDVRHDRKARGIDKVLDGLSELVDNDDLALKLQELRHQVLGPQGLKVTQSSYLDEAQNAKLADTRLSADSAALLREIQVHNLSLAGWVRTWQEAARELGEVEAQRATLDADIAIRVQPADKVRARNQAIRLFHAFSSMLEMDEPTPEARVAITSKLNAALAKAARKRGGGGEEGGGPPAA
jgi:hypothetical protein